MDTAQLTPDPAAIRLVFEAIARTLRFAPVAAGPRTLTVAVVHPLSGAQLRGVITVSGRSLIHQLEPSATVVDALIELAYGGAAHTSSASAA